MIQLLLLLLVVVCEPQSGFYVSAFAPRSTRLAKSTSPVSSGLRLLTTSKNQQGRLPGSRLAYGTSLQLWRQGAAATAATAPVACDPQLLLISCLCHVVGGLLGVPFVVKATSRWYRKLTLPTWTPPDRVFAPVWTTLYACMGVAFPYFRVQVAERQVFLTALWSAHMILNYLWAPVFFGLKRLRMGLWMNVALLGTLFVYMKEIWAHTMEKRLLLVLLGPYFVWLVFATVLNARICQLNDADEAKFQDSLIQCQKDAAAYANSW